MEDVRSLHEQVALQREDDLYPPPPMQGPRGKRQKLSLQRTETAGREGIQLVYVSEGREFSWLLGQTSLLELLSLLLRGRMDQKRRLVLEPDEVALDPPGGSQALPALSVSAGEVDLCVPMDRNRLVALRREIDRVLEANF